MTTLVNSYDLCGWLRTVQDICEHVRLRIEDGELYNHTNDPLKEKLQALYLDLDEYNVECEIDGLARDPGPSQEARL